MNGTSANTTTASDDSTAGNATSSVQLNITQNVQDLQSQVN